MKHILIAFVSFSRLERLGISVMSFVLMLLIIFRCTLTVWVHPPAPDKNREEALMLAYTRWKKGEDSIKLAVRLQEGDMSTSTAELFAFDPNILDSSGFIRLGMPAKAVKGLMNWRRKGKRFYRAQ